MSVFQASIRSIWGISAHLRKLIDHAQLMRYLHFNPSDGENNRDIGRLPVWTIVQRPGRSFGGLPGIWTGVAWLPDEAD